MKFHLKKRHILFLIPVLLIILYLLFGTKLGQISKRRQLKDLQVFFITLDTLRVDFVSAYKQSRAETPNMDRVAREGVLFQTCIAQTPLTLPSHVSMLSGTYPLYHQVRDNGGFLVPQSLRFISEILQEQGFKTSAFIASFVLHSKWGINQGFDTYSDDFDLSRYDKVSLGNVQKRAEEVLADAKVWIKANKDEKFFSWIHLYDPHTPYDPPSPFKEKHPQRPYRGEVEYMDHQLGLFFQFLKEEGLYDKSLIIMASDHGESLGEHGEDTHGFFIYDSTVKVPLIIRAPFRFPVSQIHSIVELVDLAPTVLDALDIAIPGHMQGKSLVDLMFGKDPGKENVAYTETYYPRLHYGWSELKAYYFDEHWKYILAPTEELYNLQKDKDEQDNIARKKILQTRKVKREIQKFIKEKSEHAKSPGDAAKLDKEDLQKLASLGYLTTFVNTSGKTNLPDPKGKVHVFNDLIKAKQFMSEEKYVEAIQLLKEIIKNNPQIVDGIFQLGNTYTKKRMFQEALECYYKVLEQKPDYQAAMVNVINSLVGLGQLDKGVEEVQRFLKTFPKDFSLFNELGSLYYLKQDYDKAAQAFQTSIEIERVNPHALNRLGGVYIIQKEFQKASQVLDRAFKINPELRRLNFHLAQVEEAKGNMDKASQHYKKELELYPQAFKSAYNLAEELRKRGQFTEAIEYYRKAIESNPQFNIPYFMIAKYYFDRRENLEEAIELCNQGIKIKPLDKYTAFGYYILSDISKVKGDTVSSNTYFNKAEEIKRDLMKKNQW
jgi:arylsulfatase A-like enzyme/Flp pilus assembly protein TadD